RRGPGRRRGPGGADRRRARRPRRGRHRRRHQPDRRRRPDRRRGLRGGLGQGGGAHPGAGRRRAGDDRAAAAPHRPGGEPAVKMTREVLVVQNSRSGGPSRWGAWMEEAGLRLDVVHAYDGAPVPDRLEHDAMIVLGGGYLPGDDHRAPWLAPTRKLVAQALADEVPLFGICLGGQMLAEVAGGEVTADAGAPENGSLPVTIRPEASGDPLFHGLPGVVPAIEHHVDAITALPPGA